jgi:hypothetical protein
MDRRILITLTLLLGCGPGSVEQPFAPSPEAVRYANVVCEARQSCECGDGRFASEQDCKDQFTAAFDKVEKLGLAFDEECFETLVTSEALTDCGIWTSTPTPSCQVFFMGPKKEGASCDTHPELMPLVVNECGEGLGCHDGICKPEPESVARVEGDACHTDCGGTKLYCGTDNRCHRKREPGEACDHWRACGTHYYCEGLLAGLGVCSPRKDLGEACDPRDWGACFSKESPDQWLWCDSPTNTCVVGPPAVCRQTHPALAH